jgi:predicted GNAT family acetyltransferase
MNDKRPEPLAIRHLPPPTRGAFVIERDAKRLAEMTYVRAGEHRVIIDHTFVDETQRGEGAGLQLLEAAVAWARADDLKLFPVCPFAKAMSGRHESLQDVLA